MFPDSFRAAAHPANGETSSRKSGRPIRSSARPVMSPCASSPSSMRRRSSSASCAIWDSGKSPWISTVGRRRPLWSSSRRSSTSTLFSNSGARWHHGGRIRSTPSPTTTANRSFPGTDHRQGRAVP